MTVPTATQERAIAAVYADVLADVADLAATLTAGDWPAARDVVHALQNTAATMDDAVRDSGHHLDQAAIIALARRVVDADEHNNENTADLFTFLHGPAAETARPQEDGR